MPLSGGLSVCITLFHMGIRQGYRQPRWSSYWTFRCTKVTGSLHGDPERVVAQNLSLPQWCYSTSCFLWLINTRPSGHSESKALNLQTCNWHPKHHYEKSYEKYLMLLLYIYFFKKSKLFWLVWQMTAVFYHKHRKLLLSWQWIEVSYSVSWISLVCL